MKDHLVSGINRDGADIMLYFFTVSFQASLETVRSVPELKKFVQKLETFDAAEKEKAVFSASKNDKFQVLNHGNIFLLIFDIIRVMNRNVDTTNFTSKFDFLFDIVNVG